ncbi:hypothetical protein [uncultured Maribacter sp.]|uniref:hypothetical protein n=1 Tax=uncultured Maribacter sp. TaxID=431308 RepID=UPI0026142071|nr:hypothetical protein [uncultured Maribacter sp.]
MNIINSIFSISISLIFLIINLNGEIKTTEIQNANLTKKNDCGIENVTLKTERTEKEHKFLFWSLYRKKVKVTDRIVDSNGNVIFEEKSVFICSMDACDDRKFNRIKIVGKQIWIFSHGKNVEKIKPINRYNFCGDYLGKKDWEDGDYYDD